MSCRVGSSSSLYQIAQALRRFTEPSLWEDAPYVAPDLSGLRALLDEFPCIPTPDLPRVAFVGESSSGKSTLINALMGMEILPSEVAPVTASILHLYPADRLTLVADGAWPDPSVEEVRAYLADAILDATGSAVGRPETGIGVPTDAMRAMGVSLLDTPGLGGVASESGGEQVEATLRDDVSAACALSRSAVVCMSPHQAGARGPMEVLRLALEGGRPVVIALTKADDFAAEELERVQDALREHVTQMVRAIAERAVRRRLYLSERRRSKPFAGIYPVRALEYLKALDRGRAPSEETAAGIDALKTALRDVAYGEGFLSMEAELVRELERLMRQPGFRLCRFPRRAVAAWPEVRDAIYRNRDNVPSLHARLKQWELRINARGPVND